MQLLNKHNWGFCFENEGLAELLRRDTEAWDGFWSQENANLIIDANTDRFREEIEGTVAQIQAGWYMADAVLAGQAFAHFWDVLMAPVEGGNEEDKGVETLQE